jgi:hypothetical protein
MCTDMDEPVKPFVAPTTSSDFKGAGVIPEARQIATVNHTDIRGLPARGQAEHA